MPKEITFSEKLAKKTRFIGRIITAPLRGTPNFLIIGAAKGGTTSLYDYLVGSPNVLPSFKKEVAYFDQHYARGEAWYRAHFPYHWNLQNYLSISSGKISSQ